MDYPEDLVLALFTSAFVDDALFAAQLGGDKTDLETVRLYLRLPLQRRPDVSWFFDRTFYLQKYPDIEAAGIDPLVHFIFAGVAERRVPHPLIDITHMLTIDPALLPDPPTIDALNDVLGCDLVDPSPLFSLEYYRSQLDGSGEIKDGLLRHFVETGLLLGRKPHPSFDPLAYYQQLSDRTFDVRSGLRRFALHGAGGFDQADEPLAGNQPTECQTKTLFRSRAQALLPGYARNKLRFDVPGSPDLSVLMVVHNNFALTLMALASLRENYAGDIELIIIDSGSTDEAQNLGQYVTGARILRFDSNIGFVRGCNAGLELASAEAVLYLNNDVELASGAVPAALLRLRSDPTIGAVGAKVLRSHGLLQEAGCIIWRNGWTAGYLRDQSPLCPEANFVRDVDFCSGVFLLTRSALVRDLGGFDDAFAPAYFEDTDLCVRIRAAGHRVVYDPAVIVHHLEYGSSGRAAAAQARIQQAQQVFFQKHRNSLRFSYASDGRAQLFARSVGQARGRILVIEDQVPLRRMGSGFTRCNDIVRVMAGLGFHVTVYPVRRNSFDLAAVYADFPDTVEVMHDRGVAELEAFLKGRRGYYDTIWIARTHNLDLVKPILERGGVDVLGGVRLVLDTEAISALREAERLALLDPAAPFDLDAAIRTELENAYFCQTVVAVNALEAERLRGLGLGDVQVLGHLRPLSLTPRPWQKRAGMLFVGGIHAMESPNYDSLCWFVDEVLPLIERELGYETRLTVVGYTEAGVDLGRFRDHARITLRGAVADASAVYDSHRVFVAPTRFAAGVPYKVHEAAAHGLPVVATELLRRQLGWENGQALLSAEVGDAAGFAQQVLALYRSEEVWERVRAGAAERVRVECGLEMYERNLTDLLTVRRSE